MNKTSYINQIFQQLLGNDATKDDSAIQKWRETNEENDSIYKEIEAVVDGSSDFQLDFQPDVDRGLARLKSRIKEEQQQETHRARFTAKRSILRIAAAITLIVSTATIWQVWFNTTNIQVYTQSERQTIELDDGSIIYLNENSQIAYAEDFGNCNRVLQLRGEAFFKVAKNVDCPFVVETPQTTVTVLGTSFNVKAAPATAQTEVMVMSGKVEVMSNKSGQKATLAPQEKVVHQHGQSLTKTVDKDYRTVAWHTLDFRNETIATIVKEMEKKFDVQIDLSESAIQNCTYTTNLNKSSLEEVFAVWQTSFGIKVQSYENKTFLIKGGYENCSNIQ